MNIKNFSSGVESRHTRSSSGKSRASGVAELSTARDKWGDGPHQPDMGQSSKRRNQCDSGVTRVGETTDYSSRSSDRPAEFNLTRQRANQLNREAGSHVLGEANNLLWIELSVGSNLGV